MFQSHTLPSAPLAAIAPPSGLKAALLAWRRCPRSRSPSRLTEWRFQSITVPSWPPDASVARFRPKATLVTVPLCPDRKPRGVQSSVSHSPIISPSPPEASVVPSGLKATLMTSSLWPRAARAAGFRCTSQILSVSS